MEKAKQLLHWFAEMNKPKERKKPIIVTNPRNYSTKGKHHRLARAASVGQVNMLISDINSAINNLQGEAMTSGENAAKGMPVQRPLFLHYEDDAESYTQQFEYLYGSDLLVAPVWQGGKTEWNVYLPSDGWVHLWTGKEYGHGNNVVPAPLGDTPVFYKKGSTWSELFESIRAKYGK